MPEQPLSGFKQPPIVQKARPPQVTKEAAQTIQPPAGPKADQRKSPDWTLQEEVRLRKLILSKAGLDSTRASLTDLKLLGDPKILYADNLYWRQIEADFSTSHAPGTGISRSYVALYVRYLKELLPRDAAVLAKRREGEVEATSAAPSLFARTVKSTSTDSFCSTLSVPLSPTAASGTIERGDAASPVAVGRAASTNNVAPSSATRPPETCAFRLPGIVEGPGSPQRKTETRQSADFTAAEALRSLTEPAEVGRPPALPQAVPMTSKPTLPPISTITAFAQPAASTASAREFGLH